MYSTVQECRNVPREKCYSVPYEDCETVEHEYCFDKPQVKPFYKRIMLSEEEQEIMHRSETSSCRRINQFF